MKDLAGSRISEAVIYGYINTQVGGTSEHRNKMHNIVVPRGCERTVGEGGGYETTRISPTKHQMACETAREGENSVMSRVLDVVMVAVA